MFFKELQASIQKQNKLIKKQNKRLQEVLLEVQYTHTKLDQIYSLFHPTNQVDNGAFETAQKLTDLQNSLDGLAGTVVNQPVGTEDGADS